MFRTEQINYDPVEVHLLYYDVFDCEEQLHNLLPSEQEKWASFKSEKRAREFVATRVLRTMIFGKEPIYYNAIGAPLIQSEGYISISHAESVVGLAFCKHFPVGLDLEPFRSKVLRVAHKFLSEEEKQCFDTQSIFDMIKVWSAKEALYKLAERKGIIFSDELLVKPISGELWAGRIIGSNQEKNVILSIREMPDFVVSVNTQESKYVYK